VRQTFRCNEEEVMIDLEKDQVSYLEERHSYEAVKISNNCILVTFKEKTHLIYLAEQKGIFYICSNGDYYCLESSSAECCRTSSSTATGGRTDFTIKAPMPGSIVKIAVKEQEDVKEGQCLAVIEAMKMEMDLCAPSCCRIEKILVKAGDQVESGELIISLKPLENGNDNGSTEG